MPDDRDTRRVLLDATYEGQVVNRDDPEGLGRIKVVVPGILEPESDWIRPMATFGGSKQRGIFAVPKIDPEGGATVEVVFLHGDSRYPRYMAGPWGRPGGVSDVPAQAEGGNPDLFVIRFGEAAIVIDERVGQEKMTLLDVRNGSLIRLNINTQDVELTSLNDELVNITRDETRNVGRNWKVTVTGNAEIDATGTLKFDGTPDIKGGAAASAFVVLATIKTWLDTHIHSGVTTGPGATGAPTIPSPTTDFSTKFKAE